MLNIIKVDNFLYMALTSSIGTLNTGTSVGRLVASGITSISNTNTSTVETTTVVNVSASKTETRVRISLPPQSNLFYKDSTNGLLKILQTTNGVIFPFQPVVVVGFGANYTPQELTHSNFAYNFYQSSKMNNIDLTGEFVVRNPWEGSYALAAMHFLRSCTMMFTGYDGVVTGSPNLAGSPPPVLRLNGMGFGGLDNIPVVLSNVVVTYPENVDYVTVALSTNADSANGVETTKIPVSFNISVSCIPMFSRDFASNFSVDQYSRGAQRLLGQGFDN